MSTLQRMILAFALVVAIGAGQGLFTLYNLNAVRDQVSFVAQRSPYASFLLLVEDPPPRI